MRSNTLCVAQSATDTLLFRRVNTRDKMKLLRAPNEDVSPRTKRTGSAIGICDGRRIDHPQDIQSCVVRSSITTDLEQVRAKLKWEVAQDANVCDSRDDSRVLHPKNSSRL